MNILTNYQSSIVVVGTILFFISFILGYYLIYGHINLWNGLVTTILFLFWLSLTKIISNYINFTMTASQITQ